MKIIQKVLLIIVPCVMITYAVVQLGADTVNNQAIAASAQESAGDYPMMSQL